MTHQQLAQAAVDAKGLAYAPYSQFHVGAALLGKSGKVYIGCNVESAAYSGCICAERTALTKAVSEGERDFAAIAIAGSLQGADGDYCFPCGECRQMLNEFVMGEAFEVVIAKTGEDFLVHPFAELLPYGFSGKNLNK